MQLTYPIFEKMEPQGYKNEGIISQTRKNSQNGIFSLSKHNIMKQEVISMSKSFREEIDARYELISRTAKTLEEKVEKLPDGRLKIKRHGNSVYYYFTGEDTKERLLKKEDKKLLEDLLQKSYLEKVVKASKTEIESLNRIKKLYPDLVAEDVYMQLPEERKAFVKPIVPTDEQFIQRWQSKAFTPKPVSADLPVYLTMKGERVRSKSEVIIADRLNAGGIPYMYECPVTFKRNDEMMTVYPDFTILRISDRKTAYLEHCGRMDDPGYAEDMINRINDYSYAGIIQGDNLFLTFETSAAPIDMSVLEKMINKNFR